MTAGKTQPVRDLLRFAAEQQPPRRSRRTEAHTRSGALEAALEMPRLNRKADADRRLVPRDHGRQHIRPLDTLVLGHRESRSPRRDARMQHRADMRVVAVEARTEG